MVESGSTGSGKTSLPAKIRFTRSMSFDTGKTVLAASTVPRASTRSIRDIFTCWTRAKSNWANAALLASSQTILLSQPASDFPGELVYLYCAGGQVNARAQAMTIRIPTGAFFVRVERGPVLLAELARFALSCRSVATRTSYSWGCRVGGHRFPEAHYQKHSLLFWRNSLDNPRCF